MDLSNIDPGVLYCMFKGEPGTRKSTAALSFPTPQYWFSADKKMDSLLLPMRAWNVNPKEIHYDDYTDWNEMKRKLEQFTINCPYKTIIIDSITSVGDNINRQTLKFKGNSEGKKIAGIGVNSIEDFNAEMSCFQEMIALTKDISHAHKVNVILIGHIIQTEQKTPGGQTVMSRTIVTGGKKAGAKMPAYCSEIYHFNISSGLIVGQGGTYEILTTHTGDDFARTALPIPNKIEIRNDQLYSKYLTPAINTLREDLKKPPVTKI